MIQQIFTRQNGINQGDLVLFSEHHAYPSTGLKGTYFRLERLSLI